MIELPPLDTIVIDFVDHVKVTQNIGTLARLRSFYEGHDGDPVVKTICNEVKTFSYSYIPSDQHYPEWKELEENRVKSNKWGNRTIGAIGLILVSGIVAAVENAYQSENGYISMGILITGIVAAGISLSSSLYFGHKRVEAFRTILAKLKDPPIIFSIDPDDLREELHKKQNYVVKTLDLL